MPQLRLGYFPEPTFSTRTITLSQEHERFSISEPKESTAGFLTCVVVDCDSREIMRNESKDFLGGERMMNDARFLLAE
jgi:hypothetical protein